jgi:hypothetical protein
MQVDPRTTKACNPGLHGGSVLLTVPLTATVNEHERVAPSAFTTI